MLTLELKEEFFSFIHNNLNADVKNLALKFHGKTLPFDFKFALLQIEARKKYKKKLPEFIGNPHFLFPDLIAGEQSTSEALANFHAELVPSNGDTLDMTSGLGIDIMAFAKNSKKVTGCEIDPFKANILKYNCNKSALNNIQILNEDSIEYLKKTNKKFDLIFIDPARRDVHNKRVYNLSDCKPDYLNVLPLMRDKSKKIILKCSPMLDITQTKRDLSDIISIRSLSFNGECKELLIEQKGNLDNDKEKHDILYEAIDLDSNGSILNKLSYYEKNSSYPHEIRYVTDGINWNDFYLYEPNAAVMKLSPWKEIQDKYPEILKLGVSSHLFIHKNYLPDFPGRKLKIERLISKKDRTTLKGSPVNIVTRNYYTTPEIIRKELKLSEGKDKFLYATKVNDKPLMILSTIIND